MALAPLENPLQRLTSLPNSMNWRGGWDVTQQYYLYDVVVSPTDGNPYILSVTALLGGADPALSATPDWEIVAASGSGVVSITADPTLGVQNVGTAQNVVLVNTGVLSITADPVTGINNTGTPSDPILVNTGVISIATDPVTGLQNTGTATNQVLVNTGVLGITAQNGCTNAGTAQNPIIENSGVISCTAQNGCTNTGTATAPVIENTGVLTVTAATSPSGITIGGSTANPTIAFTPLAQGTQQFLNPSVSEVITLPFNITSAAQIHLTFYNDNVVPPASPWNANPVTGQLLWWNLTSNPNEFAIQLGNTPFPVGTYGTVKWVVLSV